MPPPALYFDIRKQKLVRITSGNLTVKLENDFSELKIENIFYQETLLSLETKMSIKGTLVGYWSKHIRGQGPLTQESYLLLVEMIFQKIS